MESGNVLEDRIIKLWNSKDPDEIRKGIMNYMIMKKFRKYGPFLIGMRMLGMVPSYRDCTNYIESFYIAMRYLDNFADRDMPLPKGYLTPEAILLEKRELAGKLKDREFRAAYKPKDAVDVLLIDSFNVGERLGIDVQIQTETIIDSLLFDSRRYNNKQQGELKRQKNLHDNFFRLDTEGTARAAMTSFREDPDMFKKIDNLATACRRYYNLRDWDDDVASGFYNISAEEAEEFGITIADLHRSSTKTREAALRSPDNVKRWWLYEAKKGMDELKSHNLKDSGFKLFTKFILYVTYEAPTRRYLNKIIGWLNSEKNK